MSQSDGGLSQRVAMFLVDGPDPPHPTRPPTLLQTLLPWPVRVLAVITLGLLAWNWSTTPLGRQLGGGLQYAGLVAVSLAISFWWWVFVVNMAFALAWLFWPLRFAGASPLLRWTSSALTFINRQIGHIEVLAVWIVLALVSADSLTTQTWMLASVLFLGEPVVNGLARLLPAPKVPMADSGDEIYWKRRPLFYLATFSGLAILALLAPRQWPKLIPGVLALALADAVRIVRHRRCSRALAGACDEDRTQHLRFAQKAWSRHTDALFGPGLVLLGLASIAGLSLWARHRYQDSLASTTSSRGEPVDYCLVSAPPAPDPEVAAFLVSDSQLHELHGNRFVGQMEFAEALVPVALRPVELDVLSASSLWRFATVYSTLAAERPADAPLWWGHLGDMADLSCRNEIDRAGRLLHERYDATAFAGVAPGNHDRAFTGNFFWSPYWDSACPSGRLEKELSDEILLRDWKAVVEKTHGRMSAVPNWSLISRVSGRGSALVTATPLGPTHHNGRRRGVIAIFLDTSDGQAFDLGVAGLFGTFSAEQARTADAVVSEVRDSAGADYEDPLYVIFMHHPLDETSPWSNKRLSDWIGKLDAGDPRVLGIVSAHTHEAQKHSHCIAEREIPEIVVGSTIDPPQEAALLTIGPVADGTAALRVQTLPVIARPGKTCSSRAPLITANDCQQVMAGLRGHKDCAALFRPADASALGRDCSVIEHPSEIEARLQLASRWTGPVDSQDIAEDQRARTKALWSCICRDNACTPSPTVLALDDESYSALLREQLGSSVEREKELTCLAWAGAAVQRYKSTGMRFADALRCAFDDDSLAPARDYISRFEVTPCY
jgi:hypothetical protein